jgi:RimJ/RimL family protein N-acetyltransferase
VHADRQSRRDDTKAIRSLLGVEYPDLYPVTIRGERLRLREVGPDDAPAAMHWAGDAEFFRHLAVAPLSKQAEERELLREIEQHARTPPRRHYHLGIVWNDTDDLIGLVRLSISVPEHRGADIGYGLRRDRWGEGIATEAATLLVDFGFRQLRLHRVFAYHHPGNVASGRVMTKLGMQYEGQLRENVLNHDGTWRDSLVYAILKHEWRR